jgi:hypothetical protein
MAEDINVASYRLVALTYRGGSVDLGGIVSTSRLAMLYQDAPNIRMASYRLTVLASATRNPDLKGVVSTERVGMVYLDAPTLRMASYRLTALTAQTRTPDFVGLVQTSRLGFIIRPPAGFVSTGRLAFIINQVETGSAAYVPQFFQKVSQKTDFPSTADTISTTRAVQLVQRVVQQVIAPMPWSQTRVMSETLQAVQKITFSPPQSMTAVMSEAMQVLQSDIHQHVPVSMDYVSQQAMQVVQQTPMQIWQSPHYALSLAQWELYRTPMGFLPRSTTTAYHVSFKVLQQTPMGYLPWSDTAVSQVAMKTLFDYTSPLPDQGTDEVYQEVMVALQHTDGEPLIVGPNLAGQNVMQVVQSTPLPVWQSDTRALQLAELVVQEALYDPPGDIGKTNAMQSVLKVATQDTDYTNPDIMQSQTAVPQMAMVALQSNPLPVWTSPAVVPQAHLEWLQWTQYPSPGDMIPPVNAALTSQLGIQTLQHSDVVHPQSFTRALQLAQLTSQYLFYTPASDLATKGIFIGQTVEAVARNAVYPDPAEPISPVYSDQISVMTAYTDDTYPDPTKEAQPGEAFQVVETIASEVEYPDPTVSQVWAEVTQAVVQKATSDTFPDPTVPVSSVTLTQISIQASTSADYGDPANMVSPAEVSQAVTQVSKVTSFPNPANPASTLTVDMALQMVALPDPTLYGVPDYAIKHRPIITISIVYIQTS